MRKHEVKCQIEGDRDCAMSEIQKEINRAYVKTVENILRKSEISKMEMIEMINQIQEIYKNL